MFPRSSLTPEDPSTQTLSSLYVACITGWLNRVCVWTRAAAARDGCNAMVSVDCCVWRVGILSYFGTAQNIGTLFLSKLAILKVRRPCVFEAALPWMVPLPQPRHSTQTRHWTLFWTRRPVRKGKQNWSRSVAVARAKISSERECHIWRVASERHANHGRDGCLGVKGLDVDTASTPTPIRDTVRKILFTAEPLPWPTANVLYLLGRSGGAFSSHGPPQHAGVRAYE